MTASFVSWVSHFAIVGISARTMLFPVFANAFLLIFGMPSRIELFLRAAPLAVSDLHGGLLFMHAFDELSDHALELHEGSLLRR